MVWQSEKTNANLNDISAVVKHSTDILRVNYKDSDQN